MNASGYVSSPGEQICIGFYSNNLLDEKYVAGRSSAQPPGLGYTAGMPQLRSATGM
ncbi:hypothetical protein [Rhizorhabdus argentea]|uniref:hypothetical protein n=1 Tax=Rhizorhabdus argentea TaxID=1387174 RepID=UPI0030EE0B04